MAGSIAARAGEVPVEPMLQIETGMHRAIINDVAISPDGSVLSTVSDDKTLRLWSLATGDLLDVFRPPISPADDGLLFTTAFARSGKFVLAGGVTGLEWDGRGYIYLFGLPDGEIANRRLPIPGVIQKIAYRVEADGSAKYLAVAFSGAENGVIVFDAGAKQIAEDLDYAEAPSWVEFGPDGRLFAVGGDGYLRIYDAALKLVYRDRVAGAEPLQARPSPDGRHVAVSYLSDRGVDVYRASDGAHERRLFGAAEHGVPYLGALAWSTAAGGLQLWAAGGVKDGEGRTVVRRWSQPLSGDAHDDFPVAHDAVTRLETTGGGRLVYASADPSWGVLDAAGRPLIERGPEGGDFRRIFEHAFSLSPDGEQLRFNYGRGSGGQVMTFDLRRLRLEAETGNASAAAGSQVPDALTEWRNASRPRWRGVAITLEAGELSRSAAALPNGGAVIGADRNLYLIAADGTIQASRAVPAAAWGVAASEAGDQVVAALGDGTLRFFSLRQGHRLEEQAALFVHRDLARWILWTPDGHFTHSDNGGQELAGYHLNDGPTEAGRWVDFAQLYRSFYDPRLVQRQVGVMTEEAALFPPSSAPKEGSAASVLAAPAPSIELVEFCPVISDGTPLDCVPADQARRGLMRAAAETAAQNALPRGADRMLLRFKVSSAAPLSAIDVFVNGHTTGQTTRGLTRVSAEQEAEGAAPGTGGWLAAERLVRLADGANLIEVRAYDERGIFGRSKPMELIAAPERDEEKRPTLYVLAIGIDDYQGDVQPLSFARADAMAVAETLEAQRPGSYDRVELIGLFDAEATANAIAGAFDRLAAAATERDSVVVYIAGHGTLDEQGTYQFLPADVASWADIARAGISQGELVALLGRIPSANTAILVDTCHSGAIPAETPGTLVNETGFFVLAASASVEEALDGYDGRNGVFAYAVLEALRGRAANYRGEVDVLSMGGFVRDRVPELAGQRNFRQRAEFKFSGGTLAPFPLSEVATPPKG